MFIHKSIKFLIVCHKLNRIIKFLICIHVLCRCFPFTSFLCYLIHPIITYGPPINIKRTHFFIKKITGRVKLIQIKHNFSFQQISISCFIMPHYHNSFRYILIRPDIIFLFIVNHSKIMINRSYHTRILYY